MEKQLNKVITRLFDKRLKQLGIMAKIKSPEELGLRQKLTYDKMVELIGEAIEKEAVKKIKEDGFVHVFPKIPFKDIESCIDDVISDFKKAGWTNMKISQCSDPGVNKLSIYLYWE